MVVVTGNPLKSDAVLRRRLQQLNKFNTAKSFNRWRASFLEHLEEYLVASKAEETYDKFTKQIEAFVKDTNKIHTFVEKGDISPERSSVKARMTVGNWSRRLMEIVVELDNLMPSTTANEQQRGYNKFQMGAILVQTGFKDYAQLVQCQEILEGVRPRVADAIDRQILDEMTNYSLKFKKFCDVLADLGLLDAVVKSAEFDGVAEDPDEPEPVLEEPEILPDLIFVDMKTGAIGYLDREKCLEMNVLTPAQDGKEERYQEAALDEEGHKQFVKMVTEADTKSTGKTLEGGVKAITSWIRATAAAPK